MNDYDEYVRYKDMCYKCSNFKLKDIKEIITYLIQRESDIETMSNTIISYRYGFEKIIDNEIIEDFYYIINSFINLCKSIHITNALGICMLYSYLLWNGYFSFNHNFTYGENTDIENNTYALNIINGQGTCLAISDLLSYILNAFNINNAILINKLNNNHHAYNLILSDTSFIYDATNKLIFKIESINSSSNKDYYSDIDIERSYSFINNINGLHTLDLFVKNNNDIINITDDEINKSLYRLMELFKNNIIFKQFHMTISPSINKIYTYFNKTLKF